MKASASQAGCQGKGWQSPVSASNHLTHLRVCGQMNLATDAQDQPEQIPGR